MQDASLPASILHQAEKAAVLAEKLSRAVVEEVIASLDEAAQPTAIRAICASLLCSAVIAGDADALTGVVEDARTLIAMQQPTLPAGLRAE